MTPIIEDLEPEKVFNITQAHVFERLNELSSGAREMPCLMFMFLIMIIKTVF